MAEKQTTLKKPVSLKGKGLHTGMLVEMTIKPAPVNHGIQFCRIDLDGQPCIRALAENVVDTSRSTVIGENGARVGTIEHTMSALFGMGIDNALVEVNAPETPILDGSARFYVEAIDEAGIEEQEADKHYFIVKENFTYRDDKRGVEIKAFPDDNFSMHVMIDYNSEVLGNQYATLEDMADYKEEIASCRTFVFFRELEFLHKNNLIKGGDLDNAIVIVDKEVTKEEIARIIDLFKLSHPEVKQEQGILDNIKLRFINEPARHKVLDMIGDLALIGMPVKGRILGTRPGHAANIEFAKQIRQIIKRERSRIAPPSYDPNKAPLYTTKDITKVLPHRPPFLLIDKIIEMSDKHVVGLKNVTMNEPFFVGHFPEEPIMPGVLIVEGIAQVGGILVLNTVPDPENYITLFMKIERTKFRRQVVPGDTILFYVELTAPIRRGIANVKAYAFVGDNVVAEGEFMAQIIKSEDNKK